MYTPTKVKRNKHLTKEGKWPDAEECQRKTYKAKVVSQSKILDLNRIKI